MEKREDIKLKELSLENKNSAFGPLMNRGVDWHSYLCNEST